MARDPLRYARAAPRHAVELAVLAVAWVVGTGGFLWLAVAADGMTARMIATGTLAGVVGVGVGVVIARKVRMYVLVSDSRVEWGNGRGL